MRRFNIVDMMEDLGILYVRRIPEAIHACCKRPTVEVLLLDTYVGIWRLIRYVYTGRVPSYYLYFSLSDSYFWLKAPEKALGQVPWKVKGP
jgi:hypothetical protein